MVLIRGSKACEKAFFKPFSLQADSTVFQKHGRLVVYMRMTNGILFSGSSVRCFLEPWLARAKLWPNTAFVPQLQASNNKDFQPLSWLYVSLVLQPFGFWLFKVFLFFFEHKETGICTFYFPLWEHCELVCDFLGCRWFVLTVWWRSLWCLLGLQRVCFACSTYVLKSSSSSSLSPAQFHFCSV